jgi:hypothetical protein
MHFTGRIQLTSIHVERSSIQVVKHRSFFTLVIEMNAKAQARKLDIHESKLTEIKQTLDHTYLDVTALVHKNNMYLGWLGGEKEHDYEIFELSVGNQKLIDYDDTLKAWRETKIHGLLILIGTGVIVGIILMLKRKRAFEKVKHNVIDPAG